MNCACEEIDGRVVSMCGAHAAIVREAMAAEKAEAATKKDLLGIDIQLPKDPKETPKPTCSSCGGEILTFYCYLFKLKTTQGNLLLNSFNCPHANCRALFAVHPIGLESGIVATPGQADWPGVPS